VPAGQLEHEAAPAAEKVPALQSEHDVEPAAAEVPAEHWLQLTEPDMDHVKSVLDREYVTMAPE